MAGVQSTAAAGLRDRPGDGLAVLHRAVYGCTVRQLPAGELPARRRRGGVEWSRVPPLPRAAVLVGAAVVLSQLRTRLEPLKPIRRAVRAVPPSPSGPTKPPPPPKVYGRGVTQTVTSGRQEVTVARKSVTWAWLFVVVASAAW